MVSSYCGVGGEIMRVGSVPGASHWPVAFGFDTIPLGFQQGVILPSLGTLDNVMPGWGVYVRYWHLVDECHQNILQCPGLYNPSRVPRMIWHPMAVVLSSGKPCVAKWEKTETPLAHSRPQNRFLVG